MTSRNPKAPRPTPSTPKAQRSFTHQDGRLIELLQALEDLTACQSSKSSADTLIQRVKDDPAFSQLSGTLQSQINTYLGVTK